MYIISIAISAALLYCLTGSLLGIRLSRGEAADSWPKFNMVALGGVAIVLHGIMLSRLIVAPGGVNLGFFNALSLVGWLSALLLLALTLFRPVENLGIVLLPFSAVTVLLTVFVPTSGVLISDFRWPLNLHIGISVVAYALLALAAVQALLLAVVDRRLRHHHPGGFMRGLPPLSTLESLLFQFVGTGFLLLSLALLSGLLFLEDIFAQHLVHKTTLSMLAWALFGILLYGRLRFGWRGRTAVRWTLAGFGFLMLAYFGSELVLQLVLERR